MKTKFTLFILLIPLTLFSQQTIFTFQNNANWNNGLHWSTNGITPCNCTPDLSQDEVIIEHTTTANTNHTIEDGATLSITDAGLYNLNGALDVDEGASLIIEGNGEVNVTGDFTIHDESIVIMNTSNSQLNVVGDFTNYNNDSEGVVVDGTIDVDGDVWGHNNSTISGAGYMNATGDVRLNIGAQTSSIFGSTSDCFGGCEYGNTALPVELSNFSGTATQEGIQLVWSTSSEVNNTSFELERSDDGNTFATISRHKGAGNSSTIQYYQFIDSYPYEGINYYRLVQTDFNGNQTTSHVITVDRDKQIEEACDIKVYQKSSGIELELIAPVERTYQASLNILDITGKSVFVNSINMFEKLSPDALPAGLYLIHVDSDECKKVKKVYIN